MVIRSGYNYNNGFKKVLQLPDSPLFSFLAPCSASKRTVPALDLHGWGMHDHG